MHQPSRRQFVTTSLVGLPILAGGTAALLGSSSFTLDAAEGQGSAGKPPAGVQSPPYSDPVLDAILADFAELKREGDAKPSARKGSARGMETLTGVLGAHLGQHYDAALKRGLRQQIRQQGRQAFVQDIVTRANKAEFTHEKAAAMLERLERDGMSGVLRDIQKAMKRVRESLPPDVMQVRATMQYDFCADVRWMIELAEFSCALACGFAFLGPEAVAACTASTIFLAGVMAMKWWYGC